MDEEEDGAEAPPAAPYPRELGGCPPTVPGQQREHCWIIHTFYQQILLSENKETTAAQ